MQDGLPRVWHFSLVIAGLLLATPVTIKLANNGNSDEVGNANGRARETAQGYTLLIWDRTQVEWKKVSLERLREHIGNKIGNNLVTEAVLYFLEKKNAHLVEGSNPGDEFKAMYLIHFINHVFIPIAEYCEETIKNHNDFHETNWSRRLTNLFTSAPGHDSAHPPLPTEDDRCFGMPVQLGNT